MNINSKQKTYTILTYLFGNYDCIHRPDKFDSNCEYIIVTDNPNLNVNFAKVILFNKFQSPLDLLHYVRCHPFEFCKTDICFLMDANLHMRLPLTPFYEKLKNHDILLCPYFYMLDTMRKLLDFLKKAKKIDPYNDRLIGEIISNENIDIDSYGGVTYKLIGLKKSETTNKLLTDIYALHAKYKNLWFDELLLNCVLSYIDFKSPYFVFNDIFYSEFFDLFRHNTCELIYPGHNVIYNNIPKYPVFYKNKQYIIENI